MIHFIGKKGTGAASVTSIIGFNPGGGEYSGASINVTITVTAPKLRWQLQNSGWVTVNASSTVVPVTLTQAGKFLSADALDGAGNPVASTTQFYQSSSGGGQ